MSSEKDGKKKIVNNIAKENIKFAKIIVIGVGGGGCNAINTMIKNEVSGVEFWAMNTDAQALTGSKSKNKLVLGMNTTKGLGAGADPKIGLTAAMESKDELKKILKNTDMLFIAAGMGGGTGTGGAPVIAKIAHEMEILTVGIVTRPFSFEGASRTLNANEGIAEFVKYVDSHIIISNDRLVELVGDIPFQESFNEADKILTQSVQTITDLIAIPASINLDFADIRNTMSNKGTAVIGIGMAKGNNRPEEAAERAIVCPLIDVSISGAKTAIVNITSNNASLNEVTRAIKVIETKCKNNINIIYGMAENKELDDELVVSIIATGFENEGNSSFEDNNYDPLEQNEEGNNNYNEPTESESISDDDQRQPTSKIQSVYDNVSFTEQLDIQKKEIISSRKVSKNKIDAEKKSGKRNEYEKNAKRKLQKGKKGFSIIPSFLRRDKKNK